MKISSQQANKFIEGMGVVAQSDGLPRIAGRLMGLMILEDGPFSFSELATRLDVSRGSISTNTRLLANLGVIEKIGKPGERQHYFQIAEQPYAKLLQGLIFSAGKAAQLVANTQKELPQGSHQAKLDELKTFYQTMIDSYQNIIDKLSSEP